ncbi:MAG TPA: hypothetical protein P5081_06305 [Phycisphaerae bacterium]|nr:hypothetical protein [Phycisphaerae bacterium]HRW52481.1 hypothetical protein [Phycisphaerae bacterium]
MKVSRFVRSSVWVLVGCAVAALSMSCNIQALNNLTAPSTDFGVSGQLIPRAIQVGFVNNTNARAIFTFGAYDQLDQATLPTNFSQLRLEANSSSAQIAQPCRRTFSVGGAELIRLINENENNPSIVVSDPRALVQGVNFSTAPLGDPLEAEPTEGTSLGREVLLGVDFTCSRTSPSQITGSGLLIFTFEEDAGAPGGFRIDYQFVEP